MPANGVRISCRRNLLFADHSIPHRQAVGCDPSFETLRTVEDGRMQKTHDALSYTVAVMGHAARCRASRRGCSVATWRFPSYRSLAGTASKRHRPRRITKLPWPFQSQSDRGRSRRSPSKAVWIRTIAKRSGSLKTRYTKLPRICVREPMPSQEISIGKWAINGGRRNSIIGPGRYWKISVSMPFCRTRSGLSGGVFVMSIQSQHWPWRKKEKSSQIFLRLQLLRINQSALGTAEKAMMSRC